MQEEEIMSARVYLIIAAVVAILYSLAFLLIPVQTSLFFSGFAEARAVLYLRFCGAAVLAWGLIVWFARDFRDWDAVRGVLLGSVVGLAIHHYKRCGDYTGLADRQRLGIDCRACVAVTRRHLSAHGFRLGSKDTEIGSPTTTGPAKKPMTPLHADRATRDGQRIEE